MSPYRIAVLVGSLRKESFNLKMARALIKLAPATLQLEILKIGQLPMYNQDLDENPPSEWVEFRKKIRSFDGILFVTPEYNRSIPGVLKNALDVASRPYGDSAWDRKPGAVVSVTPGETGAFGANHHLRQTLVFLNVPVMQQPEAYISKAADLFAKNGDLEKESTVKFAKNFMEKFAQWIDKTAPKEEDLLLLDEAHIPKQEAPQSHVSH